MNISIIGTGRMSVGITQVFISKGYKLNVIGRSSESTKKFCNVLNSNLDKLVAKQKISDSDKQNYIHLISTHTDYDVIRNSDIVIEVVVEDIEIKKGIFKKLDDICNSNTILASNTSSISITELAAVTNRPEKVIGMHFFNPAPIMKLVEVVRGLSTSDDTYSIVRDLCLSIGKEPIEIKDSCGFAVNRILIPMINEAICLLNEGVASKLDIDKSMKLGANHPMGPLELSDFIGNDVVLAIMEILYKETGDSKYRPCPLLKKMVRAGYLGNKTKIGFYSYQ